MLVLRLCLFVSFVLILASPSRALDLAGQRLVDLTHSFNADTIYWPTSPSGFELNEIAAGETEGGYFYSAYTLSAPEHGGTHLDAPVHFSKDGVTTEAVPLEQLMAPAVVVDISAKASADPDYRLSVADLEAFERNHGRIEAGTIVLVRTDWSRRWPDRRRYLGDDTPGDASNLHFPSFSAEAMRALVEDRGVRTVGIDTASIDYGPSKEFAAHRVAAAAQVAGLENLTNLAELPPRGALVFALPMKIEGGSGGPVRVVALVESRPAALVE